VATDTQTKTTLFQPLIDAIHEALGGFWQALSPTFMKETLDAAGTQLGELIVEVLPAKAPPGQEFLAPPGTAPRPGQLTEEEFWRRVVTELQLESAAVVAKAIAAFVAFCDVMRPLLEPETIVRYTLGLAAGAHNPDVVARKLAQDLLESIAFGALASDDTKWKYGSLELPNETDDVKEAQEVGGALRAAAGIGETLGCLPPQSVVTTLERLSAFGHPMLRTSSPGIGRRVHRAVILNYRLDHPLSPLVADGRAWVFPGTFRLSNLEQLSQAEVTPDIWRKVTRFRTVMRDGTKTVRPDIADLSFTPGTGGWYEIKPVSNAVTGWHELHCYYMPRWNKTVPLPPSGQIASPGDWMPNILFWERKERAACVILPPVDGVITYLTFKVKINEDAAAKALITTMGFAAMFLKRVGRQAGRGIEAGAYALGAVALFVAAWATIIVAALLTALAIVEIAAGAAVTELLALAYEALLAIPALIAFARELVARAG
jgi:hypothetical protein